MIRTKAIIESADYWWFGHYSWPQCTQTLRKKKNCPQNCRCVTSNDSGYFPLIIFSRHHANTFCHYFLMFRARFWQPADWSVKLYKSLLSRHYCFVLPERLMVCDIFFLIFNFFLFQVSISEIKPSSICAGPETWIWINYHRGKSF